MNESSQNQLNVREVDGDNIKRFIEKNYADALKQAFNDQKEKAYAKAKEELELELQSREEAIALQQKECNALSESLTKEKNAFIEENQALSEALSQFAVSIQTLNKAIDDTHKACEAEKLAFAAMLVKKVFSLSSLPSLFEDELSNLSQEAQGERVALDLSREDYGNAALKRYFETLNYVVGVNKSLKAGEINLKTPSLCYHLSAEEKIKVIKANLQDSVDAI
ncbi:hypothetical protein [Enterovibrio baiacu]|uniref:hypothetical protein n=1 Tax=Enterovibrio baiacu TaxID=2491023 RepID=UPI0010116DF4|nr:hypothetical protein [Enterovibrio baiacu]MBE1277706.1 hypothetical protein [Enterovibrio baiacu]